MADFVNVNHEDRKAAWPFRSEPYQPDDWGAWMCGRYDHIPIIQVIARRRTEATKELLEALEAARPTVERWCHTQGNSPELFARYVAPIDAAIAKAKGGEASNG